MFYFLFIFKPIDKLLSVVVLCEQLKLQAFQTIKKLERESSDNTLLDQTMFAEQITIHGCYLSKKKAYFYSCFSPLKSLTFLVIDTRKSRKAKIILCNYK